MTSDKISELLDQVAASLDMPQNLYDSAEALYRDVGTWLGEKDQILNRRDPEIYPQGSFRLGTVIKPASDEDHYDIDLVYLRDIQKTSTTQETLKEDAGKHLKDYVEEKKKDDKDPPTLDSGRRCWTLDYPPLGFHMDVLPAIPDDEGAESSLLITDCDLSQWQHSDPIGYANWFWNRMIEEVKEQKEKIATLATASVADVPDWKVKTTLQKAVQLLKRHRDMQFGDDKEQPISIIITTLAARAYKRQDNLFDALKVIVRGMKSHIENRDGVWWVPNPVNEDENFADKWEKTPEKADKFFGWLAKVQSDFNELENRVPLGILKEGVSKQFGSVIAERATANLRRITTKSAGALRATASVIEEVPPAADTSHRQSPSWPVGSAIYPVRVTAGVYKAIGATKQLWPFTGLPQNKNLAIKFVASTPAPRPYEIWWQVVNTGSEARKVNVMRGTFFKGLGGINGEVNWETTAYRGTHFVEAFVIGQGRLLGRSGHIAVRIR